MRVFNNVSQDIFHNLNYMLYLDFNQVLIHEIYTQPDFVYQAFEI